MKVPFLALAIARCALALSVQQPILRFTENGTFQISVFSDLHYGEGNSKFVQFFNLL